MMEFAPLKRYNESQGVDLLQKPARLIKNLNISDKYEVKYNNDTKMVC